jgi:hypothetical protein
MSNTLKIPPLELVPAPAVEPEERKSQLDMALEFALAQVELFHDANKDCYAKRHANGYVWRLNSQAFKDFLSAECFKEFGKALRAQNLAEVINQLSAMARCDRPLRKVYCRIGQFDDHYYIDLCQPNNTLAVRWGCNGWQVVDNSPIDFVRTDTMQPLPVPLGENGLGALWQICNVPPTHQLLFITWLIDAWRLDTPFPGLEFLGEQGSAKSTTAEAARRLVDPNSCNLRAAPKAVEDIFVAAGVNHVVAYENLSQLSSAMQDALCVLSTGGGYARRKLYSDADEHVINVRRPWVVNGISACVTQQDLLDRTITIECPVIQSRQQSSNLWQQFEQTQPALFSTLLNVACRALQILPCITLAEDERPRMLEFCLLGMAISQVLKSDARIFLNEFQDARRESISRTIDSSPVCTAIIEFMQRRQNYTASVKDLLTELERLRPLGCDSWPRSAKGLGDALRRAAPALRVLGIDCRCLGKTGGVIKWSIIKKL